MCIFNTTSPDPYKTLIAMISGSANASVIFNANGRVGASVENITIVECNSYLIESLVAYGFDLTLTPKGITVKCDKPKDL